MSTPGRLRALRAVALSFALILAGEGARAEEPGVPARIDFRGTDGCADPALFERELAARDARVRPAGPGERAPVLEVTVTRPSRALHGRLVVQDVEGATSRREVEGESCESVLGALALMAAIAIDPTAPLSGTLPAAPRNAPPPGPRPVGEPPVDAAAAAPRGSTSSRRVRMALAAGAGATTGISPAIAWALPFSVEIAFGPEAGVQGLVRAGYEHADSGSDTAGSAAARFVLDEGTLEVCASFPLSAAMRLLPCVHAEGGALGAAGSNITPARSQTTPWAAAGVVGAARYGILPPLFVEVSAGVRFPFVRDRFFFEPDTTVFRPAPVAGFASGSLGVTFL